MSAHKNKNYDEELVRESLECAICKDFFNEPKQLVCGHTFCRHCVERLDKVPHVRNDFVDHLYPIHLQFAVQCPQCRDLSIIPPSGLNTNYVIKEMVEKFRDIEVSHYRPSATGVESHSKISCGVCKRQNLYDEMFMCRTCTTGNLDNKKIILCGFCIVTRGHKDHEIIICTDFATSQDFSMAMNKSLEMKVEARANSQQMKTNSVSINQRLEYLRQQINSKLDYFDTFRTQCMDAGMTMTKHELENKLKELETLKDLTGQANSQLDKIRMESIQRIAAIASTVERFNLLQNAYAEQSRVNLIDFDSVPSTSNAVTAPRNCFAYNNDELEVDNKKRRAMVRRIKTRRFENVASSDDNAARQISPIVLD